MCLTISRIVGSAPSVDVYLALRDPHSYLLVQAINDLSMRYNVNFKLFLVYESVPGFTLSPKLMQFWALKDAQELAAYFGLNAQSQYPRHHGLIAGQQLWQLTVKDVSGALDIFNRVWSNAIDEIIQPSTPVINFQVKNQQRLLKKGHYLPATLHFAGVWFTGVERLKYLEQQLTALKLNKNNLAQRYGTKSGDISGQIMNMDDLPVLEVYLSLRSPYSYLGLVKALKLAKQFQIKVKLKPVVPLVMRGLKVPISKQRYTYKDVLREAKSAGIPFSSFNEPTGQGVVNCYQLFAYAELKGKAQELIESAFEAIYVRDLDLARQSVVLDICEQVGIDYQKAMTYQESHDWQLWSEKYLRELSALGLWGVPCFKLNDTCCWGQDRLFIIEKALIDLAVKSQHDFNALQVNEQTLNPHL